MSKMMGRNHDRQCDCNTTSVSGHSEKCNRRYGNKRQRSREKRAWIRDLWKNFKENN